MDSNSWGTVWAPILDSAAILVALSVIMGVLIAGLNFAISWNSFMKDWKGSAHKDGRKNTVGIVARLENLETELKHNGGSSVKDAVKRIEEKVNRIEERIEKGDAKFQEGERRLEHIERKLFE